jgi:glycosyltransferase Alg8
MAQEPLQAALDDDDGLVAWREIGEWLLLLAAIAGLALLLPEARLIPGSPYFLFALGVVGVWRYVVRSIHFLRAAWFLHVSYPRLRERAELAGSAADPSHVYFLATSFRIDAKTTGRVYSAILREAIDCGFPATIVASIVEFGDELLIRALWEKFSPPERISLKIVRIAGTGKRDGLAFGFRAISRDNPDARAVVAVVDGDSILLPGVIKRCAQMFHVLPKVGALTTNEFCTVHGGRIVDEWHKMRFAERHLNMCSMALTHRVLTLTGRMSLFRASIVTDPHFITDVESDSTLHWRLGRVKFLTGDDKSSWFSVVRLGWDTFYLPDAAIQTVEHPPDPNFFRTSYQLMFRWYGNSLRQNTRARALGPRHLGWFTYYVLQDQRIQMWTGLLGISAAIVASFAYSFYYLIAYLVWVGLSRYVLSAMLLLTGHRIRPLYPTLMYYNQIVGSVVKIIVLFFPDRQSWTRQKTQLKRDTSGFHGWFNTLSSRAMLFSAVSIFAAIIVLIVSYKPDLGG